MVFKFSYEIIGLRDRYNNIAGMEFQVLIQFANSTVVHLDSKNRLAVAPCHRQRFDGGKLRARSLIGRHGNPVLVLYLDHFNVVLDLRKFLLFHGGVYESMT